jgi:hypothetical protein
MSAEKKVELTEQEKAVLKFIRARTLEEGGVKSPDDIRPAFLELTEQDYFRMLRKFLREALITDLGDGRISTDWEEETPSGVIWLDPDKLPWKSIMPKSKQAQKKGPHENTPEDKKSPIYKEIMMQLLKAIETEKKYNVVIQGYTYWFDQYNGGISRRKVSNTTQKTF